jgi:hypothetical protein
MHPLSSQQQCEHCEGEAERMKMEVVMAHLKIVSQHVLGKPEENIETLRADGL